MGKAGIIVLVSLVTRDRNKKGRKNVMKINDHSEKGESRMKPKDIIKGLQTQGVRTIWVEEEEKWYFALMDLIRLLTENKHPKAYWQGLKKRLVREGYTVQISRSMTLSDVVGNRRKTLVVDMKQFFRIVQSIRTPRAESWKSWLAQVGEEEVKEAYDPERGVDRALDNWRKMGRDEKWILQRMMSQGARSKLTQYWGSHGIRESEEFRALTNRIHSGWSKLTVQEHKELKGLRSQNLRDHMTEAELIFTTLAEMAARQIAESRNATGYEENAVSAEKGAGIAGDARKKLEKQSGNKIVTNENFLTQGDGGNMSSSH